jgi:hypothetical protein
VRRSKNDFLPEANPGANPTTFEFYNLNGTVFIGKGSFYSKRKDFGFQNALHRIPVAMKFFYSAGIVTHDCSIGSLPTMPAL